jgi:hypothetical protein
MNEQKAKIGTEIKVYGLKEYRVETSVSHPDPGFWWPGNEKIYSWKKHFIFFSSQIAIY